MAAIINELWRFYFWTGWIAVIIFLPLAFLYSNHVDACFNRQCCPSPSEESATAGDRDPWQ